MENLQNSTKSVSGIHILKQGNPTEALSKHSNSRRYPIFDHLSTESVNPNGRKPQVGPSRQYQLPARVLERGMLARRVRQEGKLIIRLVVP